MPKERDRTEIRRAHSFEVCACSDPACGPHFIALDATGEPICEIVISRGGAYNAIDAIYEILKEKHKQ